MQINKISQTIPKQISRNNSGRINNNDSQNLKNNVSFKGGLDVFCLGVANAIENGGLFVSFTLQDMIGTNIPRPVMGLMRNKKENKGQTNKRFALKELTREMITGPSMFIIPATMLAIAKKAFGKTINVPMKAIKALGEIHAAQPAINGQAIGKQEFVQNAFTTIIQNAKSETVASEETINKAKEFASRLFENVADKKAQKGIINSIASEITDITKNHAKDAVYTDFTSASLSKNASFKIKDTISYITSYADDVVEKAKSQDIGNLTEYVNKITNKKVVGRFAMNAAMFAAVITFLQFIPKLYNKAEGKDNAGLKGLMKEETLKADSNENTQNKKEVKQDKSNKDKSKVSFGSSAGLAGLTETLTGNSIYGRMAQGIEFSGVNLSFPLLLGVMTLGILYPRTKQAKDKYDREEILRRDVVTCATMCFAEKELRKGFSKLNENKSGLVLAAKAEGFKDKSKFKRVFDYLRPIKGVRVLTSDQIVSKYSGIENYKDGITGFCNFIENQGGNLKKVFSLTDKSQEIVESILQKDGQTLASADNSIIKEALKKAQGTEELNKLLDLFKDKNNPWVTKAKTLNARFTALSVLVLVPAFLGFFLPWFNEKTTKRKVAEENAASEKINTNNNNQKQIDISYFSNKSDLFKDFETFAK